MTDQQVVLTLLTGIELIVLLIALALALRAIQHSLDRVQLAVAKIYWGVRAIEAETDGLRSGLPVLRETIVGVVGGAGVIAETLTAADAKLAALAGQPAREG